MSVNWKKTLFVVCDIVIAAYLLLAVTAFNKPDAKAVACSEVKIDVEQTAVEGFITAEEIKRILTQNKCYPLSRPMADIPIRFNACDDHMCTAPEIWEYTSEEADGGSETVCLMPSSMDDVDETPLTALRGLLWIFVLGFLGGLLAIFTPCVWPIIPMTVSFFLKKGGVP